VSIAGCSGAQPDSPAAGHGRGLQAGNGRLPGLQRRRVGPRGDELALQKKDAGGAGGIPGRGRDAPTVTPPAGRRARF